jgi:hypothetical protein
VFIRGRNSLFEISIYCSYLGVLGVLAVDSHKKKSRVVTDGHNAAKLF